MDYVMVVMVVMVVIVVFVLLLDFIWLSVNKGRYDKLVRYVQGSGIGSLKVIPALLAYVLVVASIVFFAIPLVRGTKRRFIDCLIYGGGLGLCIYGIFNFTNMSIFKNYDLGVALLDTVWGVVLYTAACFLYVTISKK